MRSRNHGVVQRRSRRLNRRASRLPRRIDHCSHNHTNRIRLEGWNATAYFGKLRSRQRLRENRLPGIASVFWVSNLLVAVSISATSAAVSIISERRHMGADEASQKAVLFVGSHWSACHGTQYRKKRRVTSAGLGFMGGNPGTWMCPPRRTGRYGQGKSRSAVVSAASERWGATAVFSSNSSHWPSIRFSMATVTPGRVPGCFPGIARCKPYHPQCAPRAATAAAVAGLGVAAWSNGASNESWRGWQGFGAG